MKKTKKISKLMKKGKIKANQDKVQRGTINYLQRFPKLSKEFVTNVRILFKYFTDPKVPTTKKSVAVGALLYFISPLDAIPDLVPVMGFLDDIGVVALAMSYLSTELKKYQKV